MIKIIKTIIYLGAFSGAILLCTNAYIWYKTGEWGTVSFVDILSYFSGKDIDVPDTDPSALGKWIGH